MNRMGRRHARGLTLAAMATLPLLAGCGMAGSGSGENAGNETEGLSSCSIHVHTNTYDGPDYWGTITFVNTSAAALTNPVVSFKVPSGVSCDYDPTGWKHSQSGTTCTYTPTKSVSVASEGSYTLNYSTDSSATWKASSVTVSSASCGTSSSSSSSSSSSTSSSSSSGTTSSSSSSSTSSSSSSTSSSSGASGSGLFASCSKAGGCVADCSPPANDPIATGNKDYDQYDGCILAAMAVGGWNDPWMGQLMKAQMMNESGIVPSIEKSTSSNACGGQNCGVWAISAGSVSGDSAPGPCGSSSTDPATGTKDYSHSYGLFQSTPACEGTFLTATLPAGVTCTATTTANDVPFDLGVDRFYCESATSIGFTDNLEGNKVKGYINAWQTTSSPLYATSVFNPAYQIYMYMDYTWKYNFADANAIAKGCTTYQEWYLSLAYWLNGAPANSSCKLSGAGLQYAKDALSNYQTLYGKAWPYPAP